MQAQEFKVTAVAIFVVRLLWELRAAIPAGGSAQTWDDNMGTSLNQHSTPNRYVSCANVPCINQPYRLYNWGSVLFSFTVEILRQLSHPVPTQSQLNPTS
ncbi:hypothetical protein QBC46DRAFT_150433 [Diplogelasinospora grovesii]|uniref:Secreted protein n=1 Tax=Diplogelasinospora grovesii TaxID=303347 RepID=A0AAN6N8R1_9PEZI|nr:hypothetical protein QBC46DRAFT_150433 [Diplogelasinospora grovesii]